MPEPNPAPTPTRPQEAGGSSSSSIMTPGEAKPNPDPTELTSRAIDALRIEQDILFDAKLDVIRQRLDDMDKASIVLEETVTRTPTEIQTQVSHLKELHDEKFTSVDQRFRERDTRSERESRDNKVAVDAAFAAQKEAASEQNKSNTLAIDKSEKATAETLNKQADLFTSRTDALISQLNDLKLRVNGIESNRVGGQESRTALYAAVGFAFILILGAITIFGFVATGNP